MTYSILQCLHCIIGWFRTRVVILKVSRAIGLLLLVCFRILKHGDPVGNQRIVGLFCIVSIWKNCVFEFTSNVVFPLRLLSAFVKPRSRRLGGFLLCLRFIYFFLVLSVSRPKLPAHSANCCHQMMSSSANYRPFLSSFRDIPPQKHFVKLAN